MFNIKKWIFLFKIILFVNCLANNEFSKTVCSKEKCYCLERFLGAGAFGSVYLAKLPLDQIFAIKSYHQRMKNLDYDWYLEQSTREYDVGIRLNHPHIIKAYELFTDEVEQNGDIHLVVEYIEGLTLHEFPKNSFSKQQTLKLTTQVIEALRYAISKNIINIDMSTSNVMVTPTFDFYFVDLGSFFQISKDEGPERFLHFFDSVTEMCIQIINKSQMNRKERMDVRGEIKKVVWQYFEDFEEKLEVPIDHYFDHLIDVLKSELKDD